MRKRLTTIAYRVTLILSWGYCAFWGFLISHEHAIRHRGWELHLSEPLTVAMLVSVGCFFVTTFFLLREIARD